MYKYENVSKVIRSLLKHKCFQMSLLHQTIVEFFKSYEKIDNLRCVFDCEPFARMCHMLGICTIDPYDHSIIPSEMLDIFTKFSSTDMDIDLKRHILYGFAEHFANCADDEECCENRIYIIIKHLSTNADFLITKEYDSLADAEKDIDDTYIACCDDIYLGENMWFPILCAIRAYEYDNVYNFSTFFEFDAADIEDGRTEWEKANCI